MKRPSKAAPLYLGLGNVKDDMTSHCLERKEVLCKYTLGIRLFLAFNGTSLAYCPLRRVLAY